MLAPSETSSAPCRCPGDREESGDRDQAVNGTKFLIADLYRIQEADE